MQDFGHLHTSPRFSFDVSQGGLQVPVRILQDSTISMSSQLRACDGAATQRSPPALCQHCSWDYANQMLLKLLLATHLHTEFYLTLDADVLLRRPLRYIVPWNFEVAPKHWQSIC